MQTILALDIGTEFIKVVLAGIGKQNRLEVLAAAKERQKEGSVEAGAVTDIPAVVATAEAALNRVESETGLKASLAVVGMAGDFVKSSTTTVHYTRKKPNKPISEAEMTEIIKKVQQKSGEVARKTLAVETGNENIEVSLINSAIVAITIDGYKVMNPLGFKGEDVVIQFYTAFAPLTFVAAIEKVCAELNLDLLTIAVEPFALSRAYLGDETNADFSAVLVDVGGGTTNVAVIRGGDIVGTKMFSIGGQSFTRQVATALGVDLETAEVYKLQLDSDEMDERIKDCMLTGVEQSLSAWLMGLAVALEEFGTEENLPKTIMLSGGGVLLSGVPEALAVSDWYQGLPFLKRPVVHLADVSTLPDIDFREGLELDGTFMTALGLLRVGADTLASAPAENKLRAKIAKILQK